MRLTNEASNAFVDDMDAQRVTRDRWVGRFLARLTLFLCFLGGAEKYQGLFVLSSISGFSQHVTTSLAGNISSLPLMLRQGASDSLTLPIKIGAPRSTGSDSYHTLSYTLLAPRRYNTSPAGCITIAGAN